MHLTYSLWGKKTHKTKKTLCGTMLKLAAGGEHRLQKGELHRTEKITS